MPGYDLKPIGRGAPSSVNDKIVKGIDGIYQNKNADSNMLLMKQNLVVHNYQKHLKMDHKCRMIG